MSHPIVTFQTSDVKTYEASNRVVRLVPIGPRGGDRPAEFLTPDQVRDLIANLQRAIEEAPDVAVRSP